MTNLRPIDDRERQILQAYSCWTWGMDPVVFYRRWAVSQDQLSELCHRSPSTVRGWFRQGRLYRCPKPGDRLRLGLADLLLEQYEALPPWLLHRMEFEIDEL